MKTSQDQSKHSLRLVDDDAPITGEEFPRAFAALREDMPDKYGGLSDDEILALPAKQVVDDMRTAEERSQAIGSGYGLMSDLAERIIEDRFGLKPDIARPRDELLWRLVTEVQLVIEWPSALEYLATPLGGQLPAIIATGLAMITDEQRTDVEKTLDRHRECDTDDWASACEVSHQLQVYPANDGPLVLWLPSEYMKDERAIRVPRDLVRMILHESDGMMHAARVAGEARVTGEPFLVHESRDLLRVVDDDEATE